MKTSSLLVLILIAFGSLVQAQQAQNIFVITTDGFRWQEVFNGADSVMIHSDRLVKDTGITKDLFWHQDQSMRRQKLMPFFWNVIASKGQLYGNREADNKVNVKNFYKISYPGYNEIFTGTTDPSIILNRKVYNKNINFLEFLNNTPQYHDKVVAFSSWNVMPYILNEQRNNITINGGYEALAENDSASQQINNVQSAAEKNHCRNDWLTFVSAKQYIDKHHPKVVYLSLGETDEYAHKSQYDMYLQKANAVDKMIGELWYYVQTNPFYKNNTTFIITTDHGRGKKPDTWFTHSLLTKGSGDIWLAVLGPSIAPLGEVKTAGQLFQNQIAATVAMLVGETFKPTATVGKPIALPQSISAVSNNVQVAAR